MKTVNLIGNPKYLEKLARIQQEILDSGDPLAANYQDINWAEFFEFTALMNDEDEIICFSGIQTRNNFPPNTARIGSRAWVSPKVRLKGLVTRDVSKIVGHHSRYIMPRQIQFCKDAGMDYCFISRQYLNKPNGLKMVLKVYDYLGIEYVTSFDLGFNVVTAHSVEFEDQGKWQFIVAFPTKFSKEETLERIKSDFANQPIDVLLKHQLKS